jgi:hypothetical protein
VDHDDRKSRRRTEATTAAATSPTAAAIGGYALKRWNASPVWSLVEIATDDAPHPMVPPVGCDTPKRAASEAARFLFLERETKLALRPHQATGDGAMTISTAHRQMSK